jgi:hypothetical protein
LELKNRQRKIARAKSTATTGSRHTLMTGPTQNNSTSRFDHIEIEFPTAVRTIFVVDATIGNEQVDLQISSRRATGTLLAG